MILIKHEAALDLDFAIHTSRPCNGFWFTLACQVLLYYARWLASDISLGRCFCFVLQSALRHSIHFAFLGFPLGLVPWVLRARVLNSMKWLIHSSAEVPKGKSRNRRTFSKIKKIKISSKLWWLQLHNYLVSNKGPIISFIWRVMQ